MRIPKPSHFISIIQNLIRSAILYARYNQRTIAKYFRKQGAQIGKGCSILTLRLGKEPYLVKIGNHVQVGSDVVFATHDGGAWIFREEIPNMQVFGPIIIEDNCVIGEGVVLFPNIRIGKNSIVGAGSVVISDIPPNTIVMGGPARPMGSIEKYKEKCIARWKEQKPPGIIIEQGRNWWNSKNFRENRKKLRQHLTDLFMNQGLERRKDRKEYLNSNDSS